MTLLDDYLLEADPQSEVPSVCVFGDPWSNGDTDDYGRDARFSWLMNVIQHPTDDDLLIVADYGAQKLKTCNLRTGEVATVKTFTTNHNGDDEGPVSLQAYSGESYIHLSTWVQDPLFDAHTTSAHQEGRAGSMDVSTWTFSNVVDDEATHTGSPTYGGKHTARTALYYPMVHGEVAGSADRFFVLFGDPSGSTLGGRCTLFELDLGTPAFDTMAGSLGDNRAFHGCLLLDGCRLLAFSRDNTDLDGMPWRLDLDSKPTSGTAGVNIYRGGIDGIEEDKFCWQAVGSDGDYFLAVTSPGSTPDRQRVVHETYDTGSWPGDSPDNPNGGTRTSIHDLGNGSNFDDGVGDWYEGVFGVCRPVRLNPTNSTVPRFAFTTASAVWVSGRVAGGHL